MNDRQANILITAPPSPLRTALQALLSSLPGFHQVAAANTPAAALEAIAAAAPTLVILIATGQKPWRGLPEAVRRAAPECRVAALVDEIWHTPLEFLQADLVLQQGAPPDEVIAALERLLKQKTGE